MKGPHEPVLWAQSCRARGEPRVAESLGLDPACYIDLVRASPAYSRAVDAKAAKMLARDYASQSRIRQHRKDIALMFEAARVAGCALPLTETHARRSIVPSRPATASSTTPPSSKPSVAGL
ncbi:MAG: NAD-binding protein [Casimicrobiaceae bacterium]